VITLAGAEQRVVAHGGWTGRVERLGAAGEGIPAGSPVRLLTPSGSLAAIARVADGGRLVTDKVLLDREAKPRSPDASGDGEAPGGAQVLPGDGAPDA
jgi:hypothetical protein